MTPLSPVGAHLIWAGHVVVFPDVEFANGACWAAFKQPLVDALSVEEVQTRHRSQLLTNFVLYQTHHALRCGFVFVRCSCDILQNLLFGHSPHRKTLNDRFWSSLAVRKLVSDLKLLKATHQLMSLVMPTTEVNMTKYIDEFLSMLTIGRSCILGWSWEMLPILELFGVGSIRLHQGMPRWIISWGWWGSILTMATSTTASGSWWTIHIDGISGLSTDSSTKEVVFIVSRGTRRWHRMVLERATSHQPHRKSPALWSSHLLLQPLCVPLVS